MNLDTQQIELIGNSILKTELIRQGFEVSVPQRDNGFDFIIYTQPQFNALPIQIKSSQNSIFGVYKKYEKFKDLTMVYIWEIEKAPRFFIMGYEETLQFLPDPNGKSWRLHNQYIWNKVPKSLEEQLLPFENRWNFLRNKLDIKSI